MQPTKWHDAGEMLSNPDLKGCHMPDGPGQDVSPPGAYLQYNEVSGARLLGTI
jgi:poly [ADP-ribose] polymerase 2/3/4